MAVLKINSRKYGKVQINEKVGISKADVFVYVGVVSAIASCMVLATSISSGLYEVQSKHRANTQEITKLERVNEEQTVIINDLSSYERIKNISEVLGMTSQKESIKVVR